jgi:pyruvate/2-oxoglutarate dehydrogenase complex dihydrolipoamide dehydrogenase (E3) component
LAVTIHAGLARFRSLSESSQILARPETRFDEPSDWRRFGEAAYVENVVVLWKDMPAEVVFGNIWPIDSQVGLPAWITAQRRSSARLTQEHKNQLARAGVEILFGQGSFTETNQIRLTTGRGEEELAEADYIILATGSRPAFGGQALGPKFVNSDQLLGQSELPRYLLIVGGGYIGCEFASIFRTLGSNLTMVEKRERLLPDWDESIGDFLGAALRSSGVDLHLGCELEMPRLGLADADHEFTLGRETHPSGLRASGDRTKAKC